ncbi:MBOAT family protein [Bradyrhizobium sp. AUGA SZCCT0176]|nr:MULTISPECIES: MBOAT family O-acyltransferase [unclassified Bradyrhizobium]MBR1223293.1 MBOAT family protein [Bradyrhizobium sp. AUGA SZCCT0176]MBR1238426.1 MBOAT family protein [Bradyrhizobium sp. AUGA SZCCT0182]MBR1298724.1 MBOAT family protein [Bradyrhizobium sp. AUGA SZCCT0042]
MTFTSWQFAVFVSGVFALYYWPLVRPYQVYILVVASLFFYGFGQPELLALLAIAVFGTYFFLLKAMARRKLWLPAGIAFNLALLAFFKYKLLFVDPSSPALSDVGAIDLLLKLPLPIGISFFVFHNISLLVDMTKRTGPAPSQWDVFLYIIFFPQLVSGPITRAENFLPQIQPKFFNEVPFVEAARWIVTGYFFKLFVANNLNTLTTNMDFPLYHALRSSDRWLCLFLYSYQIYADFFGYSAIAIGLGLLFGYRLPINFNLPYISQSFAEFWTRWHISLSTWLRTYLYIPLGGNRDGKGRTYLNLMIVMGLGGLWHGAGLSYLAWGLMHGLLLVIERPFLPLIEKLAAIAALRRVIVATRMLVVFLCVSFLWVFFKLPNFEHAMDYISGMFIDQSVPSPARIYRSLALIYAFPVLIQHFITSERLVALRGNLDPFVYGAMAALMLIEAGPDTAFIYFQF